MLRNSFLSKSKLIRCRPNNCFNQIPNRQTKRLNQKRTIQSQTPDLNSKFSILKRVQLKDPCRCSTFYIVHVTGYLSQAGYSLIREGTIGSFVSIAEQKKTTSGQALIQPVRKTKRRLLGHIFRLLEKDMQLASGQNMDIMQRQATPSEFY